MICKVLASISASSRFVLRHAKPPLCLVFSSYGTPHSLVTSARKFTLSSINSTLHIGRPTFFSTQTSVNDISVEKIVTSEKKDSDFGIPFKRSKMSDVPSDVEVDVSVHNYNTSSLSDDRAQAKLLALSQVQSEVEKTKNEYLMNFHSPNYSFDVENSKQLFKEWEQCEIRLSHAYSQAIKYTSRILKNEVATSTAESLMYEWMARFSKSYDPNSGGRDSTIKRSTLSKKRVLRIIHSAIPILQDVRANNEEAQPFESINGNSANPLEARIPPPTSKDYNNLLRAYSLSKARRKGEQSEALISNMLEMAHTVANYHQQHPMSSLPHLFPREIIPNSKMFALAIKCYAGSTHTDSLEKVYTLNKINMEYSSSCRNFIHGTNSDDPYVLSHSIKGLKNFLDNEQREKGKEWLERIHHFVMRPENKDYFLQEHSSSEADGSGIDQYSEEDDNETTADDSCHEDNTISSCRATVQSLKSTQIDVTSAYTTVIRLLARLRGEKGAASDARKILDRMHEVHHSNGLLGAIIDIKSNAYNLILGLYRDSSDPMDATHAVELLHRMIDAGRKNSDDRHGVPLPTHQSFEYTILALIKMTDSKSAIEKAENLINLMEELEYLDRSVVVYNALLKLCTKALFEKAELYDKAVEIMEMLSKTSQTHPALSPNPETNSLVIKACALSSRTDHEIVLGTASRLFSEVIAKENDKRSAVFVTDSCFYSMMRCAMVHMSNNNDERKEFIEDLFSQACTRGLCSAAVLTLYRNNSSKEEYELTVGNGRLAESWIANVTSPRALYTDGSTRGAGKNARREGKSTSNWAKKQRLREEQIRKTKELKSVKKTFGKL